MTRFNTRNVRVFLVASFAAAVFGGVQILPFTQNAQEIALKRFDQFINIDEGTNAIRDADYILFRIPVNASSRPRVSELGTLISDYGTFVVVAMHKTEELTQLPVDSQIIETSINLPGGAFEPLEEKKPRSESSVSGAKGYYLVQLGMPVDDDLYGSLEAAGLEIVQYVPHQSFIVYGTESAVTGLRDHSRVRWTGKYLSEHKISPSALIRSENLNGDKGLFDVAVFKRSDFADRFREIEALGLKIVSVEKPSAGFLNLITVKLDSRQLEEISKLEHVFRIDAYERPVREDERAAQIVSGNYTSTTVISPPGYDPATQFGVDGNNVTVSIADDGVSIPGAGGFYITSANTVDGPLRGATAGASGGHGHINASIVAGTTPFGGLDPTNYNYGRGVAPGAHIINIPFLKSGNTTTDAQLVEDTVLTTGPNGVGGTITNNSWGAGTNGNTYDSRAALWDSFVFDASTGVTTDPINIVFSAGNSGVTGLTRPKMAKNVIAVANSENVRTEIGGSSADNIDDLRSSSSRGPAADGRIKPDITAPGTYIAGSRGGDGSSVSGQIDANHSFSTGTSHAAPQIAGVAALFTQFWKDGHSGAYPKPSLVKAAILNTGQEMTGVGSANPLPNGDEGWGRVHLKTMFDSGAAMTYQNETSQLLEPGNSTQLNGFVGDVSKPVRIALVWTDPPGAADPSLVNNLDLTVTIGTSVYKGNVLTNGSSTTGGAADTVNNVEMVRLPAGIASGTPVQIEIGATALNGDGIPGNADMTDQTFSIVGYNVNSQATVPNGTRFDFDGDSKSDISVFRRPLGEWWFLRSIDGQDGAFAFGSPTDVPVPADFTGDGIADFSFWRPSTGEWFVLRSDNTGFYSFPFGQNGDIPAPGDFDGDGTDDPAVFRPSSGVWYILRSSDGQTDFVTFGTGVDKPMVGDYDNDGKDDVAVYKPDVAQFWQIRSTEGLRAFAFGAVGDKAMTADFSGDGTDDMVIFRPSTGFWFILQSEDSNFFGFPFGANGDIPAPGDYDGDGQADATVFRPGDTTWYSLQSTNGATFTTFGITADEPVANSYVAN